jgi:hypothetical protein
MDDYHVSYFQTSLANCIAITNATLAVGEKFLYLVFFAIRDLMQLEIKSQHLFESNILNIYYSCRGCLRRNLLYFEEISLH